MHSGRAQRPGDAAPGVRAVLPKRLAPGTETPVRRRMTRTTSPT